MTASTVTPASLKPWLVRLGYGEGDRLVERYRAGPFTLPLAGFYGHPFDTRSALVGVTESAGDSRQAAGQCVGLGAPTAFVCGGQWLDWWSLSATGPAEVRRIAAADIEAALTRHAAELDPHAIYSAKMRFPSPRRERQLPLWFLDPAMMPATERRHGEDLHARVEEAIQDLADDLSGQATSPSHFEQLYKTVFWLLAAKLLHEKDVPRFRSVDLTDVDDVFRRVGRHYKDTDDLPPGGAAWRSAIEATARSVASWGWLGNTSTESLAYLYETALIDRKRKKGGPRGRDLRKELGIHSTPSPLVDHMISQLWPAVEAHPRESRRVFEPACGAAGFLVTAMRWLRDFSGIPEGERRHQYLRARLHGMEIEPFAREVAKLSLTLADAPHGNTWRIETGDMFAPGVLERGAADCTLFLANPPYEAFSAAQKRGYSKAGQAPAALTKSTEMLLRTLPHLPPDGVFGVVVPQGVMHDEQSRELRGFLRTQCELFEIAEFADNLFEEGDHETVVLLGRRREPPRGHTLTYRRVRERGMSEFKERLAFSSESSVSWARLSGSPDGSLFLPELPDLWDYLGAARRLAEGVHVQQGRQYWQLDRLLVEGLASVSPRDGWVPTLLSARGGYTIYGLPRRTWLEPSDRTFRPRGGGPSPGAPQVVMNYAPITRDKWRLKASLDELGHGASSRFLVFRPLPGGPTLLALWAILNSPLANAYSYSFAGKRQTLPSEWKNFPLPKLDGTATKTIEGAASRYLATVRGASFIGDDVLIRDTLLAVDAAVLRAYQLPRHLTESLVAFFRSEKREGVGCRFDDYPNLPWLEVGQLESRPLDGLPPSWDRDNQRRIELLRQRRAGPLSGADSDELRRLEQSLRIALKAVAPLPPLPPRGAGAPPEEGD